MGSCMTKNATETSKSVVHKAELKPATIVSNGKLSGTTEAVSKSGGTYATTRTQRGAV